MVYQLVKMVLNVELSTDIKVQSKNGLRMAAEQKGRHGSNFHARAGAK
jgi:hypothetical protein